MADEVNATEPTTEQPVEAAAPTGPRPTATGRRVYVGNLSWSTKWFNLKDHMRKAGPVLGVDILEERGRSRGCAIVTYETQEAAQNAINTLHDSSLDGRLIFVREDRMETKKTGDVSKQLFIGNLPYNVRWQDLKDLFAKIGPVVRADVLTGHDGRSKGVGTILYQNDDDAKKAIETYNDYELQGRKLLVREDKYL